MHPGDDLVTTPSERVAAASFEELYTSARGELHRALATITDDRDLATEAVDAGFTGWRRKIRKPTHIPPEVGVMAIAFKWARKQAGKKSPPVSGFRLSEQAEEVDAASLDRFRKLSLDERGLLVMRTVLGWNDNEISHAISADGVGPASRSLILRLEEEGHSEDGLTGVLQRRAASFVEPLNRLEAVRTKGTMQKIATLGAGAALVTATIAGAAVAIAGSSTTPSPAGNTPTGATATGGPLTAENAVWQEVPLPMNDDNIVTVAHDGTNFYFLGMDNRGTPVLMESPTGLDWATIPGPPGDQNMWFQHMVATPEALVVIGGGFDERRGQESTLVFISEDRETWSAVDLPSETSIEVAGRLITLHTWVNSVDVSDSGFTLLGNQMAELDPEELLREVIDPGLFRNGYSIDGHGIEFFDNQGRPIDKMSWEDLDLDPELIGLIGGGRSIVWTSKDGLEWDVSESAGPPGAVGIGAMVVTTQVSAALARGEFGPSLWLKKGDEWARAEVDFSATALTAWNGGLIVAGVHKSDGRSGVWRTTDGITWNQSELPAATINRFFVSAGGIIGLGYGEDVVGPALGPAEIEAGDLTVLASSDGRLTVIDSDGNTVVEVYEEDVSRGQQITITHPDTGEVVAEFDNDAFEQAWEAIYREADFSGRSGPPQASILMSQDGTTWTSLPMEDTDFQPSSIAIGNDSMLLVGWSEGGGLFGLGGPRPQMFLVEAG